MNISSNKFRHFLMLTKIFLQLFLFNPTFFSSEFFVNAVDRILTLHLLFEAA